MKKIFISIITIFILVGLCGCSDSITISNPAPTAEDVKISYIADFYDNYGKQWMSVEGSSFAIQPNKVKEYAYDSDGSWISSWTTSSVMSISIDDNNIETCGSTVLFYDTRLEKLDIDIPSEIDTSTGTEYEVTTPKDIRYRDYWTLNWWFITKSQANTKTDSRAVIIQSQNGDPICMFTGNEVSWTVASNLPKTTEIMIDDMPVYIHRANFAIVDLDIFD